MLEKKETQNEAEKGSEKPKKMEKPPADPHREYLDMDTDEEEFGKPETPEPEEEPPPEPEKPIFTTEELEQLVQYVKDFTVLPSLDDADWNEDCYKLIREFFQEPSKILLTIFYDVDVLTALLDFPSDAIEGLTYFLRSPWQIYTPDNFHATINFGTVSGNVENCVLKVMENVYALGIFNSKHWPSVRRNDIFTNTHDLLTKMTDTTYKLMGLTVLYVPKDGVFPNRIQNTPQEQNQFVLVADDEDRGTVQDTEEVDEAKDEGELLGRLETVANFWIRQIREAIADQNPASTLERVTDELTFWNYRYDNLRGLRCQLQNKSVLKIVEKLENMQFTSISQFHDLTKSVETAIDVAISNIYYLNLLTHPCTALEIPEIKQEQVSEILYLISFIWLESPFYNSKDQIETLCQALSTQIVGTCRESINLNTIFQGNTTEGKQKLQVCITCCEKYKEIYDEHVEVMSKLGQNRNWEVDRENVFNHVDAFVRRCRDVIEICDTTVVFGKSPKSVSFGGSNGAAYESDCNKIEKLFYESLERIEKVQYKILDVTEATWIEHITVFQRQITELEVMVGNLINSIFEEIYSIEESIEALYTLQRYNQRQCVNELLHLKWVDIWKNFDEEIRQSKQAIIDQSQDYHSSTPYYSGRAFILKLRQTRLKKYQTMLIHASDWLGDCDAQIPVMRNYKKFMSATANEEKLLFDAWERLLGEEKSLMSALSEPVLRKGKSKFGPVEVNMNYHFLDTLEEAKVWVSLNYEVRPLLKKLSSRWLTLKLRYEGVALLCRSYNGTLKRVSNAERSLFKELLKNLENSIASGFEKVTWNSPDVERFYADSTAEILNLQEFIGLYEKANSRIDQLFDEISNIRFVRVSDNVTSYEVKGFLSCLEKHKAEGMRKVTNCCEDIFRLIAGIKEGFAEDFEEIIQYWDEFIETKDNRLEESLCSAVQSSLQSILKLIQGDGISIRKALFQIKADYVGNQLKLDEDIEKIEELFKNISKFIIAVIKPLESFSKKSDLRMRDAKEFWISIEQHDSCVNLQREINEEIDDLNASINEYINSIECFAEISAIDVAQIAQNYAANEPNREMLETDISRCTKLADCIDNLANEVPITFIVLDMREAKAKMIDKCESWREILFIELSKVIVTEQKFDARTPTPIEELSLCSYDASDDSN